MAVKSKGSPNQNRARGIIEEATERYVRTGGEYFAIQCVGHRNHEGYLAGIE